MDTYEYISFDNTSAEMPDVTIGHTHSTINNSYARDIPSSPMYIVVGSTLLYSIIFLIGIFGNILVVVVISCNRRMKTTVNMYLINLCIADMLVILFCMPTALVDIFTKEVWYFGETMCKFVPFLENAIAHASVMTITAITVERYRVVRYPLKSVEFGIKYVCWRLIAIWIVSFVTCIPWLYIAVFRKSKFKDGTPINVCRMPIVTTWGQLYVTSLTTVFFLLPALILFVMNFHVFLVMRHTRHHLVTSCNTREYAKRQRQVKHNIVSVVAIFFICHLPFRVLGLWLIYEHRLAIAEIGLEKMLLMLYSARICFYLNHALNPLIYNFVSTKFRYALRESYQLGCSIRALSQAKHKTRSNKLTARTFSSGSHRQTSQL